MAKETAEEQFAKFDRDGDGRPGGSLSKGARKMAKAKTTGTATKRTTATKATAKTAALKRGGETPEAQPTAKEASAAAEKMFKDADAAALQGLPPDITREQRENQIRRGALGY